MRFNLLSVHQYAERFPRYRRDVCQTVRMNLTFKNVRPIEGMHPQILLNLQHNILCQRSWYIFNRNMQLRRFASPQDIGVLRIQEAN